MKCSNCNGDFTHEQAFIEHHCPRTSPPSLLGSQPPRAPRLLRTPPHERADIPPIQGDWNNATQEQIGQTLLERVWKRYPEPGDTYKSNKNDKWKHDRQELERRQEELAERKRRAEEWDAGHQHQEKRARLNSQRTHEQKQDALKQYEAEHPDALIPHPPFDRTSVDSTAEIIGRCYDAEMGSWRNRITNLENFANCDMLALYGVQVLREHGYAGPIAQVELRKSDPLGANHLHLILEGDAEKSFILDPWFNAAYRKGEEPTQVMEALKRLQLVKAPLVDASFETLQEHFPTSKTDDELERLYLHEEDKNLSLIQKKERIVRRYIADRRVKFSNLYPHEIEGVYESIKKGIPAIDLNLSVRYLQHVRKTNPQELMLSTPHAASRIFSDEDFRSFSSALDSPEFKVAYERLKEAGSVEEERRARDTLETMLKNLHRSTYDHISASILRPGTRVPPPLHSRHPLSRSYSSMTLARDAGRLSTPRSRRYNSPPVPAISQTHRKKRF